VSIKSVSIIGLGYIGLPTAAVLADCKLRVFGVDINQSVVDKINDGKIHIVEPSLDKIVLDAVRNGYLTASTTIKETDVYVIAVPTPFKNSKAKIPQPNLDYIKSATYSIAPHLKRGDLIILESTSPVGTTKKLSEWLSALREDLKFPSKYLDDSDVSIAYCPERVLPGNVLSELISNDRVIGGLSTNCSNKAKEFYKYFVEGECIVTNAETAEMTKLTENASRDVQIAFANELSVICDELNIDVWELISLANKHPRVNILEPGPGVGGHCIAVDPWFIVSKNPLTSQMIHTARQINDQKPKWVVGKVIKEINKILTSSTKTKSKEITIACFGLSFKPNIDDLRESPAMEIVRKIADFHDGKVVAVEPNIEKLEGEKFHLVSMDDALEIANISVLLVNHDEFKNVYPKSSFIVDVKGIWPANKSNIE